MVGLLFGLFVVFYIVVMVVVMGCGGRRFGFWFFFWFFFRFFGNIIVGDGFFLFLLFLGIFGLWLSGGLRFDGSGLLWLGRSGFWFGGSILLRLSCSGLWFGGSDFWFSCRRTAVGAWLGLLGGVWSRI